MDIQNKKQNPNLFTLSHLHQSNRSQCIIMDFHLIFTLIFTFIVNIAVYCIIFNLVIQSKYPHGFHLLSLTLSSVFVLLLTVYLITNLREHIHHILHFSFILKELIIIVSVDYLAPCDNMCHFRLFVLFILLFIASFAIKSTSDPVVNFFVCGIQFSLLGVFSFKRYLLNEDSIVDIINDWGITIITIGIIVYCKYDYYLMGERTKTAELVYMNNIEKLSYVADIHNCSVLSFDIPSLESQMNNTMKLLYNKIVDTRNKHFKMFDLNEKDIIRGIKDRFRCFIRKYYDCFVDEDKLEFLCNSISLFRYFEPITPNSNKEKGNYQDKSSGIDDNSLLNEILKGIDVENCSKTPYKLGSYFIPLSPNREGLPSNKSITQLGIRANEMDKINEEDDDYDNILYYSIYIMITKGKTSNDLSINLYFKDIKQEQLVESSKEHMKKRATHLAQIAHEFKTPLIIVSHVIKDLSGCKVINEKKFNTIYSMAEYSLSLITDLTDYSRKCNNFDIDFLFERVNVVEIVDFAFSILETLISCHDTKAGHIIPQKIISKEIGTINTDGKRLKQVLVNLFNNSYKFTNAGTIIVKVEPTNPYLYDKNNSRKRYYIENKRSITVTVEDTGIGIECGSNNKKLFKEYHIEDNMETKMRNQTGSGLGLSIVKKIVEKLGDEITYTSVYHQGTSFCFNIFDIDNEFEEQKSSYDYYLKNKRLEEFKPEYSAKHFSFMKCHSKSNISDVVLSNNNTNNNSNIKKKKTTQMLLSSNIAKPQYRNSSYFELKYSTKLSQNKSCFYSSEQKRSLMPNNSLLYSRKESQMVLNHQEFVPSPFCFNDSDQSDSCSNEGEGEDLNNSISTVSQKNLYLTSSNLPQSSSRACSESSFSIFGIIDFPISIQPSNNKIIDFISITESTKNDLIIIVEDNRVIRKCLTNTIHQAFSHNNLSFHIIGLCDGFELLYAIYYDQLIGKRIKFVFSDENMTLLNGIESYRILYSNCKIDLSYLNFFVISSYNPSDLNDINVHKLQILNKPAKKEVFERIFDNYAQQL